MSHSRGGPYVNTTLYVVVTGADFKPERAWRIPESFTDAQLVATKLPLCEARLKARQFNQQQMKQWTDSEGHQWDRKWMIVSACCRRSTWHKSEEALAAARGAR